ncbi:MAG: class I SAM-dependent methyltransferase [Deltaproteobacteria bacterium]|nr:class I SAM-dependent methyltransferase [Deltaproteobacteria bacterium]
MRSIFRETGRRLATSALCAAARFTAAVLGRWHSDVSERMVRDIFNAGGFHFLRPHYYLPIPDNADLEAGYHLAGSDLAGLEMNDAAGLDLMENALTPYISEFRQRIPLKEEADNDPKRFFLLNGTFMAVDAQVYYALIRSFRPGRIMEVGGGRSSLLAGIACIRNREETGRESRLEVIEPYPGELFHGGFPGLSELLPVKVQEVPLERFTSLRAGDILFTDSSHVLRAGNDVQRLYLDIFPRLAPGVLVHVHDVSLPGPYPRVYFENGWYWNEQYLLQAFLAFNSRFEVLWAGNRLMVRYPERILAVFPEFLKMRELYPQSEPTSFWMRVRR